MTPFKIDVPQSTLDTIRAKVRDYEWHEMPRGDGLEGSWAFGANLDYMKALCAYWADGYDWRKWETALNAFPQFTANVEDIEPALLSRAGIGAVAETADPQPRLAGIGVRIPAHHRQARASRKARRRRERRFHASIVPSLPGYGFSGKPKRPIGPRTTARLFDKLMTDVVKLPNYIAQGGDWGSAISALYGL